MGSALRLPIHVSHQLAKSAERLMADHGVEFWAAVASPSAEPFESVQRPPRLALVLGDEDRGVEPDWLSRCTRQITIPMHGQAGSLNVSVAAGILLYSFRRRGQAASAATRNRDFITGRSFVVCLRLAS